MAKFQQGRLVQLIQIQALGQKLAQQQQLEAEQTAAKQKQILDDQEAQLKTSAAAGVQKEQAELRAQEALVELKSTSKPAGIKKQKSSDSEALADKKVSDEMQSQHPRPGTK